MLHVELGGGRELDGLGLPERALGEGREPAHRLDVVPEQLDPGGALLGRPEDIEQAAANRELPALLHLVGALVAARDQARGQRVQVHLVVATQPKPRGAQRGVGDRLGERDGARDDRGRALGAGQRVERGDPQADQMSGRGDVRLVAGAARRVVAHGARREEGSQLPRQVARRAVVRGDYQRRAPGEAVLGRHQRREQERLDRGGHVGLDRASGAHGRRERPEAVVLGGDIEQGVERHVALVGF